MQNHRRNVACNVAVLNTQNRFLTADDVAEGHLRKGRQLLLGTLLNRAF
jgi:hypothetical protein